MNALITLFVTAMVISSVGFIMYVYFFSVGYGFSIAGIGIMLLCMFRGRLTILTAIMCLLFIIYGIRLGGYLLVREIKSISYKKFLKDEVKNNVKVGTSVCIWIACAILYICECAPVFFRLSNNSPDDIPAFVGTVFMALGIILEILADHQKTVAKRKKPETFVKTGLYRWVRCPNYFGELLLWTGVFLSGIKIYNSIFQWSIALLGYIGIIYVMFSGARRLELRQDRNYGDDEEYQKYTKETPIIIPCIPFYSVKKHKWLVA